MENLEKIRAACVAANPEIVELKFGCEVLNLETNEIEVVWHTNLDMPKPEVYTNKTHPYYQADYRFTSGSYTEGYAYKTLGRPIRLNDVLSTVEEHMRPGDKPKDIIYDVYTRWSLRKDRLEDQSPECLEFLASIL